MTIHVDRRELGELDVAAVALIVACRCPDNRVDAVYDRLRGRRISSPPSRALAMVRDAIRDELADPTPPTAS